MPWSALESTVPSKTDAACEECRIFTAGIAVLSSYCCWHFCSLSSATTIRIRRMTGKRIYDRYDKKTRWCRVLGLGLGREIQEPGGFGVRVRAVARVRQVGREARKGVDHGEDREPALFLGDFEGFGSETAGDAVLLEKR